MSAETPGVASDKKQNAEAPTSKTPPTTIRIPPFEKGGPGGISGGQGGIPGVPGEIWNLEGIQLLTNHLEIWTTAETEKKSGRGRSSGNGTSVYGIKKLRELILELAVRGKLVPQDPNDEPAGELLKRIQVEKAKLIAEGKIKKDKPLPPITDEEKPFELPQRWEWVRLGVLTKKLTDGSHNPPKDAGEGFPMLSSQNVNFGKIDFESPSRYVSEEDFEIENSRTRIESGDVLLTIVASLGRPAVVPDNAPKFVLQRSVAVIKTDLFAEFLCLHLGSPLCLRFYDIHGKGTAQKGIYLGQLSEMPIAVPPFSEQHCIVAKVDELMALCDQLETQHINTTEAHEKMVNHLLGTLTQSHNADDFNANWQRIAAHFDTVFTTEASIDTLKQTLLQLAVMGKLVPQDPEDEPASELLKRIQAEKSKLVAEGKIKKDKLLPPISEEEKPFELPQGWEWVEVSEIAELITSGSRDWAQYLSDEGAKFITMGNLSRDSYELRLDSIRYVNPPKDGEGSRTKLKANDLLISITGDVGNLGRIPENFGDAYINQHTCLLRFVSQCRNRYFPEIMRSPMAAMQFNAPQRGIKNSFRLGDLDHMVIPLPPLPEQHRIVTKIDELMALCDQLKSRITQASQLQKKLSDGVVEQAIAS